MKKLTLAAALSALVFTLPATAKEMPQGTIAVTGSTSGELAFLTTEPDGSDAEIDSTSLSLDAGVRYFFQENLAVGLSYNYDMTNFEYEDGSETESSTVLFAPGIFYNHSLNDDSSVVFGAELGFGSTENSATGFETQTTDLTAFSVLAEYTHFLSDMVSVKGGAAYTTLSVEDEDTGEGADISGLVFGFGLSVYFDK
ncbi:hypothetical protein [Thalassolituus sp.]|jgi:hypothetical protein|uniref:hypothetical protein n=1 Tax=Thalassolituus sp. TaxID=2030822 RepID=UPI0024400B98|tara:strand:+ start:583 stop:1176 length:594 start_codon:yes stop_codon:yes gene_type:complete